MYGWKTVAAALCLGLAVLAVYQPATDADFIWGDHSHIVDDVEMNSEGGLYRIWFDPGESAWNYWPISRTSFWVERRLWGVNASATHLVNILLHAAGVVVLFLGLRRFGAPGAWFIAGLFALHPIFAGSVAWATERSNVLSGLFYLLSIWSYLLFDEERRWKWYAGALVLFACCLLSKSSTIMLPVILIFCRLALNKTWTRRDCQLLLPFFLLSLVSAICSISFEGAAIESRGAEFERSLGERVAVAGTIPFFYLLKIILPTSLMFFYPRWEIGGDRAIEYLPFISVVVIAVVLVRNYTTWSRALFLGAGAFLVTLFPVLGFFDLHGMKYSYVADHWVYLPALPILILIGVSLAGWLRDRERTRLIVCTGILAVLGVLTFFRCGAFQNEEALWRDTLAKDPESWMALDGLGNLMQRAGNYDAAILYHAEAVRLNPDYEEAHYHLGVALQVEGQVDEAMIHYEKAIVLKRDHVSALTNLGGALQSKGRLFEAIAIYIEAIRHAPDRIDLNYNMAVALQKRGQDIDASRIYKKVLRLDPNHADAHHNLGTIYLLSGRAGVSIPHFAAAVRLKPDSEWQHLSLGRALAVDNQLDAAIGEFRRALQIKPDYAEARTALASALKVQRGEISPPAPPKPAESGPAPGVPKPAEPREPGGAAAPSPEPQEAPSPR